VSGKGSKNTKATDNTPKNSEFAIRKVTQLVQAAQQILAPGSIN
jgi:hypothetical protein